MTVYWWGQLGLSGGVKILVFTGFLAIFTLNFCRTMLFNIV